MKTILAACGVGYSSSTIITERLKDLLERNDLSDQVRLQQATLNEVPNLIDSVDIVITSSMVSGEYPIPVFSGVPFLSGIGMEELENKVLEALNL
jgi:Phosphotransferase system, galactitol-specific IIB component